MRSEICTPSAWSCFTRSETMIMTVSAFRCHSCHIPCCFLCEIKPEAAVASFAIEHGACMSCTIKYQIVFCSCTSFPKAPICSNPSKTMATAVLRSTENCAVLQPHCQYYWADTETYNSITSVAWLRCPPHDSQSTRKHPEPTRALGGWLTQALCSEHSTGIWHCRNGSQHSTARYQRLNKQYHSQHSVRETYNTSAAQI